jgi:hypothetical protein
VKPFHELYHLAKWLNATLKQQHPEVMPKFIQRFTDSISYMAVAVLPMPVYTAARF